MMYHQNASKMYRNVWRAPWMNRKWWKFNRKWVEQKVSKSDLAREGYRSSNLHRTKGWLKSWLVNLCFFRSDRVAFGVDLLWGMGGWISLNNLSIFEFAPHWPRYRDGVGRYLVWHLKIEFTSLMCCPGNPGNKSGRACWAAAAVGPGRPTWIYVRPNRCPLSGHVPAYVRWTGSSSGTAVTPLQKRPSRSILRASCSYPLSPRLQNSNEYPVMNRPPFFLPPTRRITELFNVLPANYRTYATSPDEDTPPQHPVPLTFPLTSASVTNYVSLNKYLHIFFSLNTDGAFQLRDYFYSLSLGIKSELRDVQLKDLRRASTWE